MTFIPNAEGLARLLESELGPVGIFIRLKTEKIQNEIAESASDFFHSAPSLSAGLASDVQPVRMVGSTAFIDIKPGQSGHKWGRLARKTQDGTWRRNPREILTENRFP